MIYRQLAFFIIIIIVKKTQETNKIFSFLQASTKQATVSYDVANPTDWLTGWLNLSTAPSHGRFRSYCATAAAIVAAAVLSPK